MKMKPLRLQDRFEGIARALVEVREGCAPRTRAALQCGLRTALRVAELCEMVSLQCEVERLAEDVMIDRLGSSRSMAYRVRRMAFFAD